MRQRTPSGHDIPIPESVFQALHGLQGAITAQGQAAATWQANHDSEHKALGEKVAVAIANKRHDWTKIIGAIAAAIPMIIGGTRLTAKDPPAPVQVISQSALAVELEACDTLPESNREACQRAAAERNRLRKGGEPGR